MRRTRGGLISITLIIIIAMVGFASSSSAQNKPNILVIWGDDIGQSNISAYTRGLMGYKTPNIDRVAGYLSLLKVAFCECELLKGKI